MRDDAVSKSLFLALDADADDSITQTALADWYEEHGDEQAAACLHWIVRNKRRPGRFDRQSSFGKFYWTRQEAAPILEDRAAQLPEALWLALKDNDEPHAVGSFKSYQSGSVAFRAVIAAWARVSEPIADVE